MLIIFIRNTMVLYHFSNVIIWFGARHHCKDIVVTTTNTDTSAKYDTVVHVNICGTKCNNNNWSYHGNNAKCVSI